MDIEYSGIIHYAMTKGKQPLLSVFNEFFCAYVLYSVLYSDKISYVYRRYERYTRFSVLYHIQTKIFPTMLKTCLLVKTKVRLQDRRNKLSLSMNSRIALLILTLNI